MTRMPLPTSFPKGVFPMHRSLWTLIFVVVVVLGSPQTQNAFDEGTAWYYVQTRVSQTAFGMTSIIDRTVLAVYFDKNRKVVDKAVYSLKDGKVFTMEGRKTPSFGEDKSFIQSLVESL